MEIIDQKILHDSVRWPLAPRYWPYDVVANSVPLENTKAGDILLADENGNKVFVDFDTYAQNQSLIKEYKPIGVCVVPASHTDNGTARCASIKTLSSQSDEGTFFMNNAGYYGIGQHYGYTNTVQSCEKISYYIDGTSSIGELYIGSNVGFPSNNDFWGDAYSRDFASKDPNAIKVKVSYNFTPYAENGVSKNEEYFMQRQDNFVNNSTTVWGGFGNYMHGKVKTEEEYMLGTVNSGNMVYSMLYNFKTYGTNRGDWYLPEIGELGYIPVRFNQIWQSIELILTHYGLHDELDRSYWYAIAMGQCTPLLSSTRQSSSYVVSIIGNSFGTVSSGGGYTIPFIEVSNNDVQKDKPLFLYSDGHIGYFDEDNIGSIIGIKIADGENFIDGMSRYAAVDTVEGKIGFGKIQGVPFYDKTPYIGSQFDGDIESVQYRTNYVYIPEKQTYYRPYSNPKKFGEYLYINATYWYMLPSPEMTELYKMETNPCSDESGFENTAILAQNDQYSDVSRAVLQYNPGYGVGQWYIPAAGEIMYLGFSPRNYIRVLKTLNKNDLSDRYDIWTSTAGHSAYQHLVLQLKGGDYNYLNVSDKWNTSNRAIPFIKIDDSTFEESNNS